MFQQKYDLKTIILDIFELFEKHKFLYGYALSSDKIIAFLYHFTGLGWEGLSPEKENYLLWQNKHHYKNHFMRFVYQLNLISQSTLNLTLKTGETLNDWIESHHYGSLTNIGKDVKLWEVPTEKLDEINEILGENGIVIAYQKPKPRRKLP